MLSTTNEGFSFISIGETISSNSSLISSVSLKSENLGENSLHSSLGCGISSNICFNPATGYDMIKDSNGVCNNV